MKVCQSCGMPLKKESDFGSENNGEKSLEYCSFCYQNGSFVQKDYTLEQMKDLVKEKMSEKKIPKLIIWFAIKSLSKLKRWHKKETSLERKDNG